MRKQALFSGVGLVVIATLIWAGCGSGGGDSLSKAEFTKQANTICSKWQTARGERYSAAKSKYAPLTSSGSKEKAIIYILSPYETAIAGVGELSPPSGEEEKVETLVEAMEEAMAEAKKNPLAVTEKPIFEKSNKLAESYGLEECKV